MSGRWSTNKKNRFHTATQTEFPERKLVKVTSVLVGTPIPFEFVKGNNLPNIPSAEGGALFVDTRGIYFNQPNLNDNLNGTWEVLDDDRITTYSISWMFHPKFSSGKVLASFDEETEFVIDFLNTNNCNDISIAIYVDNQPIKTYFGTNAVFLPNSSVYGKGKRITIFNINGTCHDQGDVSGKLRIYKEF
ncbi:hypothetical protein [Aquimarina litoralis]|uniref:hypothetical protein n=1 Tax=Aquimarina litoralis TaxID=584605 RepID=UPI001C5809B7|nr:hypothetical protein [Aquimarina litoralis]MBW1294970.1 hypothetical protein [Aquimarina litoralis]